MEKNQTMEKRYSGVFFLDGMTIPGEIIRNKESGVISLKLTQSFNSIDELRTVTCKERDQREEQKIRIVRYKYISGILHTGGSVTLFNCRCTNNQSVDLVRYYRFVADYMIFDNISEEDPKYSRFAFVVENGLLWSGLSQVVQKRDNRDFSNQVYFRNNNFSKKRTWSGVKIKFSTELDYSDLIQVYRIESSEVVERLKITIFPPHAKAVSEFLKIRDQIIAMISFAVKGNLNITKQYFCNEDEYVTYETPTNPEERDYKKYVIHTNEKHHKLQKQNPEDFNFVLDQLPPKRDLGETIGKLVPVFNLYSSFFKYTSMPLEMLFLNVMQALETFHSRFFYGNNKEKMIQDVHRRFGDIDSSNPLYLQLLPAIHKPNILLSARINDLFIRGKNQLFAEFYIDNKDYGYIIAQTRNYFTHYPETPDTAILLGNDLFDAIQNLKWVLEYHVCDVLGIKEAEDRIREKLDPRYKVKKQNELIKLAEAATSNKE